MILRILDDMKKEGVFLAQFLPILLTVVIFVVLAGLIFGEIVLLNKFTSMDISVSLNWRDVLVGATIYLKTSVDFAIFMGNIMVYYEGWKSRVALEIGTAVGNALGTVMILALWNFFRNVEWLLAIMIFIASLVLIELAQDGLEHARSGRENMPSWFSSFVENFDRFLNTVSSIFEPLLRFVIPNLSLKPKLGLSFFGLFATSFSIPFILGLDDFAGYVPIFNVINVFGFAVGVLAGHMVLNMALFISPKKTIEVVKNPVISLAGSIVFVGLAVWGFYEVIKIFLLH